MKVELLSWMADKGWDKSPELSDAQLVLYFFGKQTPAAEKYKELQQYYPNAHLLGCSTGGEIYGADALDDSLVASAIRLDKTTIEATSTPIAGSGDSFAAGKTLAEALNKPGLSNIFLLSDGTNVNGSDLVRGIYNVVEETIIVTGGLAGDGADFQSTLVGLDNPPSEKIIAAIGFYGDALQVSYGSVGGWSTFGPTRRITKSKENILYELDGKPALDLYKQYLGNDAARLPGSALLFPLSIKPTADSEHDIVRTIVGVNEEEKAMTFAGDIPEGYTAQLMHGDFNNLVEGATHAAELTQSGKNAANSLAILVSCIGRKLMLGQNISDETEAVDETFNHAVPMIGFYSYGEICHQQFTGKCSLHNQTMTVTLLSEND